jgi:hypothetical protein
MDGCSHASGEATRDLIHPKCGNRASAFAITGVGAYTV